MTIAAAEMVWIAASTYLAVGAVFAVYFSFSAAPRIDSAVKGAGAAFRLLIVPGAMLLWPVLLLMLLTGIGADKRSAT